MPIAKEDLRKWAEKGICKDMCHVYKKNMSKGEFEVVIKDLYKDKCDPWYSCPKFDISIFNFEGWTGWTDHDNENKCYDIFCYIKPMKHRWDRHKFLKDYGFAICHDFTK